MKTYQLNKPAGGGWKFKPLSATQKMVIARLAQSAYQEELKRGNVTVSGNLVKSKQFDDWRHEQQREACGRESLTDCNQEHYRPLKAHFEGIIGTPAAAARSFRDNMRHGPVNDSAATTDTHEARELWGRLLTAALAEFEMQPGYAAAICRTKYKCEPAAATARQLQCLTFDIRRNGQARRRKGDIPVPH